MGGQPAVAGLANSRNDVVVADREVSVVAGRRLKVPDATYILEALQLLVPE